MIYSSLFHLQRLPLTGPLPLAQIFLFLTKLLTVPIYNLHLIFFSPSIPFSVNRFQRPWATAESLMTSL